MCRSFPLFNFMAKVTNETEAKEQRSRVPPLTTDRGTGQMMIDAFNGDSCELIVPCGCSVNQQVTLTSPSTLGHGGEARICYRKMRH